MKKGLLFVLIVLLLLVLGVGGSQPRPSRASSGPCLAQVVYTMPPEAGPGLAVQCGPSWRSSGCGGGYFLHAGDFVFVTATQYNTSYGDIWYQLPDGFWAQAFGGYTTPIVYIQMGDVFCVQAIPHLIGDWSWTN